MIFIQGCIKKTVPFIVVPQVVDTKFRSRRFFPGVDSCDDEHNYTSHLNPILCTADEVQISDLELLMCLPARLTSFESNVILPFEVLVSSRYKEDEGGSQ